jgi:hypothetical protein
VNARVPRQHALSAALAAQSCLLLTCSNDTVNDPGDQAAMMCCAFLSGAAVTDTSGIDTTALTTC